MSQHPSPHSPPPDDESSPQPRRLISPQERFAAPETPGRTESQTESQSEPQSEPQTEPENVFDAQISARRRDEMERRHLPPRERARQERARLQRETPRRAAPSPESHGHQKRARAERKFARAAREIPPVATPKKRRGVPKWLKRLCALALLLFVAQLSFAALTAPQFEVESVEIRGIAATPQDDLQPLADALVGQNIVRLDTRATEKALALLPTVSSARIVRMAQWPPTVALEIRERTPFLQVGAGQDWWVVDALGVPFRRPNPQNSADAALYRVVAPQFEPRLREALNPKIWARARALQSALEADNRLAAAPKSGDGARFWQLRRIYFDQDGLASLRLSRAPHRELLVRLGDDSFPEKLALARQSLAYFERTLRRASELDLVSLQRPVWTPIAPPKLVENGAITATDAG